MPMYFIERHVPGASRLRAEELRAISARYNAVVASLGSSYAWVTSYVAGDKFYCVNEAESAEAIYRHAREGGFPVDKVTEIAVVIGPQTGEATD